MIFVVGGGSGLPLTKPLIHVNTVSGATVTFSYGGVIVKTLDSSKAFANSDGITADYYFPVPNTGSWTVTATKGSTVLTKTVSVSAVKQYDVSLVTVYIIKNGVVQDGFTRSNAGGTVTVDSTNGLINLHSAAAASSYATLYFPGVDVTIFNSLKIDYTARGYYASPHTPAFGILSDVKSGANNSTFSLSEMLRSNGGNTLTDRATKTIDISSLTGSKQIGFQEAGSGAQSFQGDINCYNLWLVV